MHVMDTKSWTLDQCKEFVREANETVDAVKATGEPWDAFIRRVSPECDLIQTVWPDKKGRGGVNFGVVKGLALLMLIGQAKKPVTVRSLKFRLLNYDIAYMTWAMYGDGRTVHPDAVEKVDAIVAGTPLPA